MRIGGIKMWREPNGREFTIALYRTPDCVENDYDEIDADESERVRSWLAPYRRWDFCEMSGLIQFYGDMQQAEEIGTLFLLAFAPASTIACTRVAGIGLT